MTTGYRDVNSCKKCIKHFMTSTRTHISYYYKTVVYHIVQMRIIYMRNVYQSNPMSAAAVDRAHVVQVFCCFGVYKWFFCHHCVFLHAVERHVKNFTTSLFNNILYFLHIMLLYYLCIKNVDYFSSEYLTIFSIFKLFNFLYYSK